MIEFTVLGTPAPQGSKKAFVNNLGRAQMMDDNASKLRPWRDTVAWAAMDAINKAALRFPGKPAISGPVDLFLIFTFSRPKSVKARYPAVKPDIDKLIRAVCDSLTTARVWEDDSRVTFVSAQKVYVGDCGAAPAPGVYVRVKGSL